LGHKIAIPQELKLLPNLVADVAITRVKFFKLGSEFINVLIRELPLSERLDNSQHIKRPSAFSC